MRLNIVFVGDVLSMRRCNLAAIMTQSYPQITAPLTLNRTVLLNSQVIFSFNSKRRADVKKIRKSGQI